MKQNFRTFTLLIIVLVVSLSLQAQKPCDPSGNGNPELEQSGEGEGLENDEGDLAWELLLETQCPPQEVKLKDYDPSDQCVNSSNLIPESGEYALKIAIIDSGIRPTQPGYFNQQHLYSYRVSVDGVVTPGVAYPHPHGTYSAGVISGMLERSVGINLFFAGPGYAFYDYQVLNGELRTSLAAVVAAIDHAINEGVELISLSIGFVPQECDNIDWQDSNSPLNAAIGRAKENGVIVITSAGNDGNDLEVSPQYPASYVNHENIVSVGALACEGETRATFSNYGEDIVDVFTTGAFVSVYYDGCFHSINGTSFSTSIVAGKAALHLTKEKDMGRVLCLLRSQTKPFFYDQSSIYGIVDVPETPEKGVCANGEFYDPLGSSVANDPTDSDEDPGTKEDPNYFVGGLDGGKSATGTLGSADNGKLTVLTTPNPFSDLLRVDIGGGAGEATISLLDGRGRQVLTRKAHQRVIKMDLGHLPAGIYWLNVRNAGNNQTRTIVKQ